MPRSRAELLVPAAVVLCAMAAGTPVAAASTTTTAPTVALTAGHRAYAHPALAARVLSSIARRRPITGERTVLPVLSTRIDGNGRRWLRVPIPGRPNGRAGWITGGHWRTGSTPWRIEIDLSQRTVRVYDGRRLARRVGAVIGAQATPTPTGRFFVEETVDTGPAATGGPYALALSARSNVLQEFAGGPGQIALHGRDHLGGALGTAQSHGCLRLSTASISWMARRIGPGVTVRIHG